MSFRNNKLYIGGTFYIYNVTTQNGNVLVSYLTYKLERLLIGGAETFVPFWV